MKPTICQSEWLEFPPSGLLWMKWLVRQALLILLLNPAFNNIHPGRRADICLLDIGSILS